MSLISEIVGQKGVYDFLNKTYDIHDAINGDDFERLAQEHNLSEDLLREISQAGLFISSAQGTYISSLGRKVTLLLRVINGQHSIPEVFNQLVCLYPDFRPYELITNNITDFFIDSLEVSSNFIRVYICSPWIRLDRRHLDKMIGAMARASSQYKQIQLSVITKPRDGYRNWSASEETFRVLRSLGAEIVTNGKLHTKLYISEPGPLGGRYYAILGSENLTGRGNIELAIKIENDNEILNRLNQYFTSIWQDSQPYMEV